MAKEINTITNVGVIPESSEFQKVNQVSQGKTGEPFSRDRDSKIPDTVNAIKGIFAKHNEKLLTLTALVGYIFVFYSGNMENWDDFILYVNILPVIIIFYLVLCLVKWINDEYFNKTNKS